MKSQSYMTGNESPIRMQFIYRTKNGTNRIS